MRLCLKAMTLLDAGEHKPSKALRSKTSRTATFNHAAKEDFCGQVHTTPLKPSG